MKYLIFCLGLVLMISAAVFAQSPYYFYDSDGNPVYLNVFDSLVAVRLDAAHSGSAEAFAADQQTLADDGNIEFIGNRTHIYRVQPGYSLSQAMSSLRWEEDVTIVNPVAYNRDFDRWKMNNQLLVTYRYSTSPQQIDSLESAFGVDRVEVIDDSLNIVVLEYNQIASSDITALARGYFNSGLCFAVEPVITFTASPASADPYYGHQYQLDNVGQEGGTLDADIDWSESNLYFEPAFTYPIVALVDAGFAQNHEDLPTPWYTWPYDAIGSNVNFPIPDNAPWNECDGTQDVCWHGTAVLGILKATTDNAIGLAGAEDRPMIMPIKIVDANRQTSGPAIARGLTWARQPHGGASSRVICITWNFRDYVSSTINNILKSCYDAGKAVVVSTGNDGEVDYPANSPYALAVGGSDRNDDRADDSGVGPELDVLAPGEGVWTLDLMGNAGLSTSTSNCDGNPNYMCNQNGTSFAAPLVAGIIAKMHIANPSFNGPPQAQHSAEFVYDILRGTADRGPYGGGSGRINDLVGWGRVNADKAVLAVKHGDANNDGMLNITDAVDLIAYIFKGASAPYPHLLTGDANCDGTVNISDAVYTIAYVFAGGPRPQICGY